jgi:hypothetical protein
MPKIYCKLIYSKDNLEYLNLDLEKHEEFATFFHVINHMGDFLGSELKKMYYNKKFFPKKTKTKDGGEIWEYNIHVLTDGELQEIKDRSYLNGMNARS